MSDKLDKLQQSLSAHLPQVKEDKPLTVVNDAVMVDNDVQDDYEYSRRKYRELIDQSSEAMYGMAQLASESEHPRAYEVLSGMMKNIAEVTDKLMDLQKKKIDLSGQKPEQQKGSITNNNVFVGSTTDLQRMLLQDDIIDHERS